MAEIWIWWEMKTFRYKWIENRLDDIFMHEKFLITNWMHIFLIVFKFDLNLFKGRKRCPSSSMSDHFLFTEFIFHRYVNIIYRIRFLFRNCFSPPIYAKSFLFVYVYSLFLQDCSFYSLSRLLIESYLCLLAQTYFIPQKFPREIKISAST